MCRFFGIAVVWSVATLALGQPPGKPMAPPSPGFLIEGLDHASPAIRLRSAQLLADERVETTPHLVDTILRADDMLALRAAVVLIERLDGLRRDRTAAQSVLKLTPDERQQVRRLMSIVSESASEPWRFYLASYVIDKLDPDSLPELLPAFRAALGLGESPLKQYAAVQALYRLGAGGSAAEADLWALLGSRICFRGLYVARRVVEDDIPAYTDEIGMYDRLFGLQVSYVISDLFVLETLRRVGAPSDRLTAALSHLAWHESQDVRLDVARQLGLLEPAAAKRIAADVLVRLLYEPSSILQGLLSDENVDIREDAMALFTRLGPAAVRTVAALSGLLSSRDNRTRLSAAVTLGRIGPPAADALPALRRALRFEQLRDSDDYLLMEEAIDRITGKVKDKPKPSGE
jgi:hypothetical protein